MIIVPQFKVDTTRHNYVNPDSENYFSFKFYTVRNGTLYLYGLEFMIYHLIRCTLSAQTMSHLSTIWGMHLQIGNAAVTQCKQMDGTVVRYRPSGSTMSMARNKFVYENLLLNLC